MSGEREVRVDRSNEMVSLMGARRQRSSTTWSLRRVTPSLRLIYAGDVRPINTALVPSQDQELPPQLPAGAVVQHRQR